MPSLLEIYNNFVERLPEGSSYREALLSLRDRVEEGDISAMEEVFVYMKRISDDKGVNQDLFENISKELEPVVGFEHYTGGEESVQTRPVSDRELGDSVSYNDPSGQSRPVSVIRPSDSVEGSSLADVASRLSGGEVDGEFDDGSGGVLEDLGFEYEEAEIAGGAKKRVDLEGLTFSEDMASSRFEGISPIDVIEDDFYEEDDPLEQKGRVNPPIRLEEHPELCGGDFKKVAGVDVSGYGDDYSVIAIRHGPHVIDVQRFGSREPMELVGSIIHAVDEYDLDEVVVDCTGGLGAVIYSRLCELGVDGKVIITQYIGNAKPRDESLRAMNVRAEVFLLLQERFGGGRISLPMDKELYRDLASIRYKLLSDGGQIRILDKQEIKRVLGRSPDAGEAVALAFYDEPELRVF